ncbi:MAG: TonB-dependent receptor plug domain-containing protein, partial [Hydrogenovibrio sp.]
KAQNVAQFSLEGGTYNTQRFNTVLGASGQQADFLFSLSNLTTDGFSAVRPYRHSNDGLENDAFQQTDVSLRFGFKPVAGHRLEAYLKNTSSHSDYDSATDPQASGPFYESDYSNTLKKLSYQYEQSALQANVYWLENEIDQFNDGKLTEYGAKGHYEYAPHQRLAASLTSKEFEGTNRYSGDRQHDYNTGVALNNTNQFNEQRLIFTQALRYDEFSEFDNKVTGKVGLKNYFTPDIFASANLGTAYNAPTLYQLTYGATDDLQPEETQAYDITLGAYGLEVTYYQTETKHLIHYGGTWPDDYYENLSGKSKFSGVEATYQTDIAAINTDLKLGYTYQSAKNDDGQWLSHRPEQQASIQIDNYSLARLHLGWETRYIGTMYDKADKQGAQIGDYFVTDLTADYAVTQHFSVYGKVINLFNDDYTSAVSAYEADGETPAYVYGNGGTRVSFGARGQF